MRHPSHLYRGLTALGQSVAHAADKDYSDFATQKATQDFEIANGGPQSDPHGLDADGDGVACESNACPCSTDQGGGGGGTTPNPYAVDYLAPGAVRSVS